MTWDEYFVSLTYFVAMKSKDENTKVGAVIVGPRNEIRSTGYNSFPRNMNDGVPERQLRPEKYFWFEHAERNAIYNATLNGIELIGCRIYTQGIPCADCARAIIQSGLTEVVTHNLWRPDRSHKKWSESCERSIMMFRECDIALREYTGDITRYIKIRFDGKDI